VLGIIEPDPEFSYAYKKKTWVQGAWMMHLLTSYSGLPSEVGRAYLLFFKGRLRRRCIFLASGAYDVSYTQSK